MIKLYDRIKEASYTIGTGNLVLSGAVNGFSSFSSSYSNNDALFYAITDGTNYEIGSGLYLSSNQIKRFPFKSTNSNQLVNFTEGLKEVYTTYPATNSVFSTSGTHPIANNSGLAIWNSANSLSYSDKIVFDSTNGRLGINRSSPSGTLDIGGLSPNSQIIVSGIQIGNSGIYFPSGNNGVSAYSGGRQLVHFEPNQLNVNSSLLFELSGIVNQNILLKKQNANTVFAGPSGGCVPPCSPDYPMFRSLVEDDIPNLSSLYFSASSGTILSNMVVSSSGFLNNKINAVSGILNSQTVNVSSVLSSQIDSISLSINIDSNNTCGRLTVNSLDPTCYNCSGTTLYYIPYKGNSISLYDGSQWVKLNFDNKTVCTFNSLSNNSLYDIFAYTDNNELNFDIVSWEMWNPSWQDSEDPFYNVQFSSFRAEEIAKFDGVYTMLSDNTKKYLGTIYTGSSNMFIDTYKERFIYNEYNQVSKPIKSLLKGSSSWVTSATSWTPITSTFIEPIKIINGTNSIAHLDIKLSVSLQGSNNSYALGIASIVENGLTSGNFLLSNYNHFGGDANDLNSTCLVSSFVSNPSTIQQYVGIHKVKNNVTALPVVNFEKYSLENVAISGQYGIMGTYLC